jgi:hypothetical protein
MRYLGGFITASYNPLKVPNYSGMWTLQAQMQATGADTTWIDIYAGTSVAMAIKS